MQQHFYLVTYPHLPLKREPCSSYRVCRCSGCQIGQTSQWYNQKTSGPSPMAVECRESRTSCKSRRRLAGTDVFFSMTKTRHKKGEGDKINRMTIKKAPFSAAFHFSLNKKPDENRWSEVLSTKYQAKLAFLVSRYLLIHISIWAHQSFWWCTN